MTSPALTHPVHNTRNLVLLRPQPRTPELAWSACPPDAAFRRVQTIATWAPAHVALAALESHPSTPAARALRARVRLVHAGPTEEVLLELHQHAPVDDEARLSLAVGLAASGQVAAARNAVVPLLGPHTDLGHAAAALAAWLNRQDGCPDELEALSPSARTVAEQLLGPTTEHLEGHLHLRTLELLRSRAPTLRIATDGQWFDLGGARVDLGRRNKAKHALLALVRAHERSAILSHDDLLNAIWPGERILPEAACNRRYDIIRRLRRLGLGPHIESADGGYRLRGNTRVQWC